MSVEFIGGPMDGNREVLETLDVIVTDGMLSEDEDVAVVGRYVISDGRTEDGLRRMLWAPVDGQL